MVHETASFPPVWPPLQVLTTVLVAGLAGVAWRHRSRPGSTPFAGLMATLAVLSALPLVLPSLSHPVGPAWNTAILTMPVFWLLFVLEYTGAGRLVTGYSVAAIAALPLVGATAFWLPPLAALLLYEGSVFVVILSLYSLGLVGVGIVLLLRFVVSEDRLYLGQSLALVAGMAAPFAVGLAGILFRIDILAVDPRSFFFPSFAVTGLAFAFALYRFEFFSVLPVTRQIGRSAAVQDLQEAVVIVDSGGRVVDANAAAAEVFDRGPSTLVGRTLPALLGDQASPASAVAAPEEYRTDDGRVYGVTRSRIDDRHERPVGWTVVFRDVTDQELRKTQLEVLNRVLRHNLRNQLSVVQGNVEATLDSVSENEAALLEQALAATTALRTIGDRAREFEELEMRADATPRRVDVGTLVHGVVEDITAEFPDAAVTTEVPDDVRVETYPAALEVVLENLLRNAVEHGSRHPDSQAREDTVDHGSTSASHTADPNDGIHQADDPVEVVATPTNGHVAVVVRDEGPGIPDHELAVLSADAETALEHGSGLGLWIAKWGAQYLGGELAFETNEPQGTTAVVTIPKTATDTDDTAIETDY